MKEQDAAHSFEKEDDDIRGHHEPDDRPQSMIDLAEKIKLEEQLKLSELTRLRSELQQKDEWISFDEQLPKDYQRVIWFDKRGGDIEIGYFVPSQSKIQPYASYRVCHTAGLKNSNN